MGGHLLRVRQSAWHSCPRVLRPQLQCEGFGHVNELDTARMRKEVISHCTQGTTSTSSPDPVVAVDGDMVTLHYDCTDEEGAVIDSSRGRDEPLTLQLGVSEIISNPIISAMEQAVRSHRVGDIIQVSMEGAEYDPALVFTVPMEHPEVQRLCGRYKSQGGLVVDKIVELQNSSWARVLKVSPEEVVLDANPMLAGVQRRLTVEILTIERPPAPAE